MRNLERITLNKGENKVSTLLKNELNNSISNELWYKLRANLFFNMSDKAEGMIQSMMIDLKYNGKYKI